MMRGFLSLYLPSYPNVLVYMLQGTEYQAVPYLAWYWRTKDFSQVMQRRSLDPTKAARLLLLAARSGMIFQILVGLLFIYAGIFHHVVGGLAFGLGIIVAYPVIWAQLLVLPLFLGRILISAPKEQQAIKRSAAIFAQHPGIKIAVAGSYGKTSMKELLATVLSEGLTVAKTPANKNVSISHAYFAQKLSGTEDVLIIEYGEGAPGDVARFAGITHPTHGVITGLAPAHLDHYKTLQAAGQDIFSLADYLKDQNVYVNNDAPSVEPYLKPAYTLFSGAGALGWSVKKTKLSVDGTAFELHKDTQVLSLKSGLVGAHQVGFLAFVAAFSLELGLSKKQVKAGISKTTPFEHRMQPYALNGAWVIDDTYNGNLEGIRAGTGLLEALKAKRKIYVSPGLVDQGEETSRVHLEMGRLIAEAKPDLVVLMKNSATIYIEQGLQAAGFQGDLQLESNPLEFYTNLKHFVAAGDLVVMQNDWTDNYA